MSSPARTVSANDAPSVGWMLGMSSWMLLTVFPGPILTWLGFSIIGVASRSRRLIILGVVWGAAAILVSLDIWGQWQALARAVVYLAGMVVALAVNPGWLRTMWQRRVEGAGQRSAASRTRESTWHRAATGSGEKAAADAKPAQGSSRSARRRAARAAAAKAKAKAKADAEAKAEAAAKAEAERRATAQSSSAREAAALAASAGASAADLLDSGDASAPAEPVDVNTATAAELEDLPGMTRTRARRAVKERDEQGGFTSLEDFGETVGLQPHEIVRLRRVATCSPRPRGERRFGRRVDF